MADRIEFRVLTRCTWVLAFACAVAVAAARSLPADAQPTLARDVARTSLPVADAGPDIAARIFDAITIDGSASHDTVPPTAAGAGLITFHWRIAAAPAGSRAAIDPASPAPSFTPDVPGRYVAELVVSGTDGVSSAPARVSVVAYAQDAAPVADAGRDRIVGVDDVVELDGDGSYDPDGVPLTFAWSFASVPAGSALNDRELVGAAGPAAHFAPDVEGRYVVELRVGNGRLTSVARTTVTAVAGNIAPVASIRATVRGGGIDLDGSASVDPDGGPEPLRYAWSLVARPAASRATTAAIRDAHRAPATFTPDVDGTYVFRLDVFDGEARDAINALVSFERQAPVKDSVAAGQPPPKAAGSMGTGPMRDREERIRIVRLALNVAPQSVTVTAGDAAAFNVKLAGGGNSSTEASLSVQNLPTGATASFAQRSLATGERTTLTIATDRTMPPGSYPIRLSAYPTDGSVAIARPSTIVLRVHALLRDTPPVACGGVNVAGLARVVYVSPAGSDGAGCGATPASACATIQQGINSCSGTGCGVLVRYGRYRTTATINLANGVNVYGGCVFTSTANPNYRTVIDASPAPGTPALAATSIASATTVNGLVVIGKDETANGTASIAMAVSSSSGLTLNRMVLVGGSGGAGATGGSASSPGGSGGRGEDFIPGGSGGLSCASNHTTDDGNGGPGQVSVPGFAQPDGCYPQGRTTTTSGNASGTVIGGVGGSTGGNGVFCTAGAPGAGGPAGSGNAGACGTPAQVSPLSGGTFAGVVWTPSSGDSGSTGAVGSGGGGGGAGGVCSYLTNSDYHIDYYGGPGGGGGGGGCGGNPGNGGQQGGASIPLVVANSTLAFDLTQSVVVPGPGGRGGDAGNGSAGGTGGGGGSGQNYGFTLFWAQQCGGAGTDGGSGGYGGAGSAGAGGHGGPSVGVALVGTSVAPASVAGVYAPLPGGPGNGGTGGAAAPSSGACSGPDGPSAVSGLAAPFFNFNNAPNNFLAPNQQLTVNQSRYSLDGTTQLTMQSNTYLCLYRNGVELFCSNVSDGLSPATAIMQTDGNLCVYDPDHTPLWCSNTNGNPGAYLLVQDAGYIGIYVGATQIWRIP